MLATFILFAKPNVCRVPASSFCHIHSKLSTVCWKTFLIEKMCWIWCQRIWPFLLIKRLRWFRGRASWDLANLWFLETVEKNYSSWLYRSTSYLFYWKHTSMWLGTQRPKVPEELALHGSLPGGEWPGRCVLYCDGQSPSHLPSAASFWQFPAAAASYILLNICKRLSSLK